MYYLRRLFVYGIICPMVGYIVIVFGSLWLEPISWIAGFDYPVWDTIVFISSQHGLVLYGASVAVGWFIFELLGGAVPVYVVNADEIRGEGSPKE